MINSDEFKKNRKAVESLNYKGSEEGSPFEIKHKFDDYRKTVGSNNGLKTKFTNALDDLKNNPDREANRRIIIIIAALVLVFLFIIDFDLSIFFSK